MSPTLVMPPMSWHSQGSSACFSSHSGCLFLSLRLSQQTERSLSQPCSCPGPWHFTAVTVAVSRQHNSALCRAVWASWGQAESALLASELQARGAPWHPPPLFLPTELLWCLQHLCLILISWWWEAQHPLSHGWDSKEQQCWSVPSLHIPLLSPPAPRWGMRLAGLSTPGVQNYSFRGWHRSGEKLSSSPASLSGATLVPGIPVGISGHIKSPPLEPLCV